MCVFRSPAPSFPPFSISVGRTWGALSVLHRSFGKYLLFRFLFSFFRLLCPSGRNGAESKEYHSIFCCSCTTVFGRIQRSAQFAISCHRNQCIFKCLYYCVFRMGSPVSCLLAMAMPLINHFPKLNRFLVRIPRISE